MNQKTKHCRADTQKIFQQASTHLILMTKHVFLFPLVFMSVQIFFYAFMFLLFYVLTSVILK